MCSKNNFITKLMQSIISLTIQQTSMAPLSFHLAQRGRHGIYYSDKVSQNKYFIVVPNIQYKLVLYLSTK